MVMEKPFEWSTVASWSMGFMWPWKGYGTMMIRPFRAILAVGESEFMEGMMAGDDPVVHFKYAERAHTGQRKHRARHKLGTFQSSSQTFLIR